MSSTPFVRNPQSAAASPQKLLVVGHSGFVGRALVAELNARRPAIEISCASTPEYDLTQDSRVDALSALSDANTTVVFLAGVKRQLGDTLNAFETNIKIATSLCRYLQRTPVRRLVYVSSAAVYGEEIDNRSIDEGTPVQPTSFYGVAKATTEHLVAQALRPYSGRSLMIVRPPLIYGPGDSSNSYGPSGFCAAAVRDGPINLWGDGSEQREFLYVGDAARLLALLAVHDCTGTLNLASSQSHSFGDVVDEISAALGRTVATTSRPRTKPQVDHIFVNSSMRRLFPSFQFTTFQQGIRLTLAGYGAPT
ncbi:MAG: NAD(P)-dependent oxidoreductase [Planctomycetia bacterium]|nr:NAD(P)-dependent oxidoreductase [Planctomycetia bacterium]